ncbi:MAG: undecaprenyl-diphosphatase UppP [Chloroflexi bacterium]|nr:undecaprenyl-diphosphatase UppP [Chloroflexota bacterium]
MTILQAIVLGIVQGLTEFLPVSSSGHLVLAAHLFGWQFPQDETFVFDTVVQMGTLLAVFVYFRGEIWDITRATIASLWNPGGWAQPQVRLGLYLLAASIPAGLAALLLEAQVEAAFSSLRATGGFLLVTAGLLWLGERIARRNRGLETLTWLDALVIGAFQALALFPGLSRSGATITGGLARGLERPATARFSFLMSIPILLAAGLYKGLDIFGLPAAGEFILPLLAGTLAAAVVGYLTIGWLLGYLARHSMNGFALYLLAAGALAVLLGG